MIVSSREVVTRSVIATMFTEHTMDLPLLPPMPQPLAAQSADTIRPVASRIVFVVDDDASVRRGLSRLLRAADYQVEPYGSAEEFLGSAEHRTRPACLLLDVRMPGLTGLDLQARLVALRSTAAIVFMTSYSDIPVCVRAMQGGAVDFLPKPFTDDELLAAVERALDTSDRCCRLQAEIEEIRKRLDTLSAREFEVMLHVVQGEMNKQVADKIGTVEKTVKVHRSRVMHKMGVSSVAALVRIVERAGVRDEVPAAGR